MEDKNNAFAKYNANIWKMKLFSFFVNLHFMGAVLVPFFTQWAKISFTQVMLLQSWFMLWVFLLQAPTGTIADYFGRKKCLMIGCIANIIAVIVMTVTPNFYLLVIGETFWALATALVSGADTTLTYDSMKKNGATKNSKQVLGRIEIFRLAGFMIGALAGSIIAAKIGLQAPMLLMSIPLTIAFIISLSFKETEEKRTNPKKYFSVLKDGMKFFYKHKILKIIAIDMIAINSIGYFIIWLYQPMLTQAGTNIALFGLVHAVFVISQIVFINNNPTIEKIAGSKKKVIYLSFIITGITLALSGINPTILFILLAIFIGGGLSLSKKPIFESYLNKYIPSPERATALSTIFMFRTLALVILSPVVGMLADWSLNNTLIILGAISIIFPTISKIEEKHLID